MMIYSYTGHEAMRPVYSQGARSCPSPPSVTAAPPSPPAVGDASSDDCPGTSAYRQRGVTER
jgi:hypothetical protein